MHYLAENAADHALQLQLIAVLLALTTSTTRSELYPDDEDIADAFYKLDDMATDDARMDAIEVRVALFLVLTEHLYVYCLRRALCQHLIN